MTATTDMSDAERNEWPDVLRAHVSPYPISVQTECERCGRACWLGIAWLEFVGMSEVVCEECLYLERLGTEMPHERFVRLTHGTWDDDD